MSVPCPNCGSHLTEKVHQVEESDLIQQVWICDDCPAEFEAMYDMFDCRLTETGKELVKDD